MIIHLTSDAILRDALSGFLRVVDPLNRLFGTIHEQYFRLALVLPGKDDPMQIPRENGLSMHLSD